MMKWFRKHTKHIMVGVVLLSLFAFVGSSALESILSPQSFSTVEFKAFGETVKAGALETAGNDLQQLDNFLPNMPPNYPGRNWLRAYGFDPKMNRNHWYMLCQEAEKAGILFPPQSTEEWLKQRGVGSFRGAPLLYSVFSRFRAVQENARRLTTTALPTEKEVRSFVRDTEEKLRIKMLVLDAATVMKSDEVIADPELQQQFESYKDVLASESESGYGYKFPPRVAIEILRVSVRAASQATTIADDDIKEYWKQHHAEYTTKEEVDVPNDPATTSQPTSGPTTQPATHKETKERELLFSEARPQIEQELRSRRSRQKARDAIRKAAQELQSPWLNEETDPTTGYKKIPEEVKAPGYLEKIRDRLTAEFGIPIDFETLPLMSQEELAKTPRVGGAKTEGESAENLSLPEYAFRIPPFFKKESHSDTTLCLQLYQAPDAPLASYPIFMFPGATPDDLYLFRVVKAEDSRVPSSLEEVRDKVAHDVRMRHAFERMEPAAKSLYVAAQKFGCAKAVEILPELAQEYNLKAPLSPMFTRRVSELRRMRDQRRYEEYQALLTSGKNSLMVPTVSGLGAPSETFVDSCFEMATDAWTAPAMELPDVPQVAATTQPAQEPALKCQLIKLPKLHKWVVVELLGLDRIREDQFEKDFRKEAQEELFSSRAMVLVTDWFKTENIERRCKYEAVAVEREPQPTEGITAPENKPEPIRF